MEASQPKFADWMAEHGYDALTWTEEMRRSLRQRYDLEMRISSASKDDEALSDLVELVAIARRATVTPKLVIDGRGASWPARVFRV
jgi:hypothetical protein